MKISMWTDIYEELEPEAALDRLLETSFRYFEFSCNHLAFWIKQGKPEELIDKIKEKVHKSGAELIQLHAPIFNFLEDEEAEKKLKWSEDALELASKLDIPWVVMHPGSIEGWKQDESLRDKVIEKNIEEYERLLEVAEKWKTGIAVENMFRDKFGSSAAELNILLNNLPTEYLGICWDTGHANLALEDQVAEIKKIEGKLAAAHIADNRGEADDHLYPLRGEIDWEELIPVLEEYKLPLNFEIPGERARTPLKIRNYEIEYGYKLGEWLTGQGF